jgi:imidazoleglycerol-phosphate dehydratase
MARRIRPRCTEAAHPKRFSVSGLLSLSPHPAATYTPRQYRREPEMRSATIKRKTAETEITVSLSLDGTGLYDTKTGIGFFDHMLDQLARHSLIDMDIHCKGDLHIDDHHTVEDCGIALGQAIAKALGDKTGIRRYGSCLLPMDDALVRTALDLSGRPYLIWNLDLPTPKIGTFDTELVREFFQAMSTHAGITLHVDLLHGVNSHHIAEAAFKSVARALREAVETDPRKADAVPSTKGTL